MTRLLKILAVLAATGYATLVRADSQSLYLQCLTNFESYAETIWTTASYSGVPTDAGYRGGGSSRQTAVRLLVFTRRHTEN